MIILIITELIKDQEAKLLSADTADEIFLALKISKEINRSIWVI